LSRRDAIVMTGEEIAALLEQERTVVCATNGRHGWPHLMPLWYVLRNGPDSAAPEIWAWTYGASQKVRNLQRDPRATLQVEAGETYDQLRGVMIEAETVIDADPEAVLALGLELATRYSGGVAPDDAARAALAAQARKRVALRFVARTTASWDHRKL
jgi:PPOX class probable F420-dependent enzyme